MFISLIRLIPRGISEKCVFLCSNNWVKKQPPVVICKKGNLNISQISRENTFEICEIFNNACSEKHTAACIVVCFVKFPNAKLMIFITLESRDKSCSQIKKAWFLLVHWMAKKKVIK